MQPIKDILYIVAVNIGFLIYCMAGAVSWFGFPLAAEAICQITDDIIDSLLPN